MIRKDRENLLNILHVIPRFFKTLQLQIKPQKNELFSSRINEYFQIDSAD